MNFIKSTHRAAIVLCLTLWALAIINASNLYPRIFSQSESVQKPLLWIFEYALFYTPPSSIEARSRTTLPSVVPIDTASNTPENLGAKVIKEPSVAVLKAPAPLPPKIEVLPNTTNTVVHPKNPNQSPSPLGSNTDTPETTTLNNALTELKPLHFITIGDSITNGYAMALMRLKPSDFSSVATYTADSKNIRSPFTLDDLAKHSTGLANSKYYDWQEKVETLCLKKHTGARWIIVSVGSNDLIPIITPKTTVPINTPAWIQKYEEKSLLLVETAQKCGIKVIWTLPPIFRKSEHEILVAKLREAQQPACKKSEVCINTAELLATNGKYSDFVSISGKNQQVRASDGVHLTMEGYRAVVYQAIVQILHKRL